MVTSVWRVSGSGNGSTPSEMQADFVVGAAADGDETREAEVPVATQQQVLKEVVQGRHASLLPILVGVLIKAASFGLAGQVYPALLLSAFHGDAARSSAVNGLINSLGTAVEVVSNPIGGAVSDTVGRKPILLFSLVGHVVDVLLVSRFPSVPAVYVIGRMILGVSSFYFLISNSMIADIAYGKEQLSASFGLVGVGFGIGLSLSPAIGTILVTTFHNDLLPLYTAAALIVVNAVFVAVFVPETRPAESLPSLDDEVSSFRRGASRAMERLRSASSLMASLSTQLAALTIVLISLAEGVFGVLFFIYQVKLGWGSSQFGVLLAVIGVVSIVGQGVTLRALVAVLGEERALVFAVVVSGVTFIALAVASSDWMVYAALVLESAGGIIVAPLLKSLVLKGTSSRQQATILGGYEGVRLMSRVFGPLLSTSVFYMNMRASPMEQRPETVLYVSAVLAFSAAMVAALFVRRQRYECRRRHTHSTMPLLHDETQGEGGPF